MTTLDQRRALALRIAKTIARDPASIVASLRSRLAFHGNHNQKSHGNWADKANSLPVMPQGTDEDDLRVINLSARETNTLHDVIRTAAEHDHGDQQDEMEQRLDFLAGDLPDGGSGESEYYPEDYDFLQKLIDNYEQENAEIFDDSDRQELRALRKKLHDAKNAEPRRIGE